ncbi:MAG TPA: tRNA (adenosine(37)-N6)-threonylcarbamoyltransferase complex ATPase subunit type 1 TsaE [Candidatus Koribacter sp.]|jgi:tRNA threonylcarbamoyladenosine biosynthesis protein TsaE
MPSREYHTRSADETIALGRTLAPELAPFRLILLQGDLGTGKTTLVKGIAEGLKAAASEDVTSPTFTLIHEYRGPETNVFHIDLYRIEKRRELDTLGIDELLTDEHNLLLVEWGEKFAQIVSAADGQIAITRINDQERKIRVTHK